MKLRLLDYHVVTNNAGTTQVVASIEGLSAGDVLIAHTYARDDNSHAGITAPAGWTTLDSRNLASTLCSYLFYKLATSTDVGATFTFTCDAEGRERFVIVSAWTGVYSSDPLGTDGGDSGNDPSMIISSLTPDREEHMLLLFGCHDNSSETFTTYSNATTNATWTEVYDSALGGGRDSRRFFAYGERLALTGTGNITLNMSADLNASAHAVIINSGSNPKVMFIV